MVSMFKRILYLTFTKFICARHCLGPDHCFVVPGMHEASRHDTNFSEIFGSGNRKHLKLESLNYQRNTVSS